MPRFRLRPVGAVVEWGLPASWRRMQRSAAESTVARAAPSFSDQEADCAILGTLGTLGPRTAAAHGQSQQQQNTTTAVVPRRLVAVAKAETGDWQVNEVTPEGATVYLTDRPKGRWRKMSPDRVALVETDSREDFHLPHKHFQRRTVDFGTYAPLKGPLPADRPVLRLSLYRESTPYRVVLQRAAVRSGVPPYVLDVACQREAFGCVTQHVSAIGVARDALTHASRHYNINAILFNPLHHGSATNLVAGCGGSKWRVLLRNVSGSEDAIHDVCGALRDRGAINYFPLASFGIGAGKAHAIAGAAARGDVAAACAAWLHAEAERNPLLKPHYDQYIAAHDSTLQGLLHGLDTELERTKLMRRLRPFVRQLAALSGAADGTCDPAELQKLYLAIPALDRAEASAAPAAFVWNAAATQRVLSYGQRVVEGDVVLKGGQPHVVGAGEAGAFHFTDVVLPVGLPGPSTVMPKHAVDAALYTAVADQRGLGPAIAEWTQRTAERVAAYRPVFLVPKNFTYRVLEDPNALTVMKTDLFLREERRPVGDAFESDRIREPTQLNMPHAVRRLIEDARPPGAGSKSVAIACTLPAGAHMSTLLREGFDVHEVHHHDLLAPTTVDTMHCPLRGENEGVQKA